MSAERSVQFPFLPIQGNGADSQGFYTAKEAARIARVPPWTVSLWDSKGIVVRTVRWTDESGKDVLGYSFGGVVFLSLIRMLRNQKFPLRKVVAAVCHLQDAFGPPSSNWWKARIFTDGTDIWVDHRDQWGVTAATRRGQKAAHELFGREFELLRLRADALLIPRAFARHVQIDREVRNGLPVIRHTTIQTATIYALHRNGLAYRHIREYYPHLTLTQIAYGNRYEKYLDGVGVAV